MELTSTCDEPVRLSHDEVTFLNDLPGAAFDIGYFDSCSLALGHPGAHATSLQAVPGSSWWLVWGFGTRILLPHTKECDAEDPFWPAEMCFLYAGHVGDHVFLRPPDWLPPV
ncbi:hypothetical protein Afil01_30860 [Actinorhabdospora filicis]|uniref:Uncharacterized protein n=1 Tax=Actinorhabdospora filicis TaxID=1785913 RepID=A0A9W6SM27_9ACTN|nr:hypothetical protein [Actinorhabdospora filicis]GLZ78279.1 hypothetical protein Afil01_30860 [Actinorhabdospora filicis]